MAGLRGVFRNTGSFLRPHASAERGGIPPFLGKFERENTRENHNARLNFFFSDELNFRVDGNLWNAYFADAFQKRKGYD